MEIGTCKSKKGEITSGELVVATTPEEKDIKLPIYIACGNKKGKTVFISGGMHGDEINGVELLHRFFNNFVKHKHINELSGTIVFLPILNPSGFLAGTREVAFDEKDLNRSFNRADNRTISNQIADSLTNEVIKKCDLGLDLHDSGFRSVLLPHVRVHKDEASGYTKEVGAIFGSDIIMQRIGVDGMMAIETYKKLKLPVITVEVGGALIIWDYFLSRAVVGLKNILINEGLLSGKIILPEKQFFLTTREGYKAPIEGILRLRVNLGSGVKRGDVLAEIYNPIDRKEVKIKADYCGIVFSRKMQGKVEKGENIISIVKFEKCDIHGRKPSPEAEMIINKETDKVRVIESRVFLKAVGLRV